MEIRAFLINYLRINLQGPAKEEEILDERPTKRYVTGILYPRESNIDPEEDQDANLVGETEDETDEVIVLTNKLLPAAMGMTFLVTGEPGVPLQLTFEITAAKYSEFEHDVMEKGDPSKKRKVPRWKRVPLKKRVVITLDKKMRYSESLFPSEYLDLRIITSERSGKLLVTVTLVNTRLFEGKYYKIHHFCYFQPKIRVYTSGESTAKFTASKERPFGGDLSDKDFFDLLYRGVSEYAVGHGVSVKWNEPNHPTMIETEFIGEHEVPSVLLEGMIDANFLLDFLANGSISQIRDELSKIPNCYNQWITEQEAQISSLPHKLKATAEFNLSICKEASNRIQEGLNELSVNEDAFRSFQLANKAMLIQISRSQIRKRGITGQSIPSLIKSEIKWRPFQISFFLLNLVSIARPESSERNVVDLLWFPTGGGKTEAYLGLIAFTIFYRRITHSDGELSPYGVTAIMRYTLRLLTIQQFERCSAMICACESIRREETDLGDEPISIGLWVGGEATPNSLKDAANSIDEIRKNPAQFYGPDPRQISSCPWCNTPLNIENFSLQNDPARLVLKCFNPQCIFSDEYGFPIHVVDEDIYNFRPTLLIGTVDKFARLPWKSEVGRIFGSDARNNLTFHPPELIIQDELHLISGPLGSLVGLYETIVDMLCTSVEGYSPKIIASTATIRQAEGQVKSLFNRKVRQFPPAGLHSSDSFFSQEASPEEKPGRIFLGVHTSGISGKTSLLRIYADLLHGVQIAECDDEIRDPYWTLVGYFNSIRELGAARTLVDDDVQSRYRLVRNRTTELLIEEYLETNPSEEYQDVRKKILEEEIKHRSLYAEELTGRVPSSRIPNTLSRLETKYQSMNPSAAIPVLLATNMISVGVDIDRLGLMVVTGQPKTTSEYIQSTSRVGRKFPGLIVTLYNWSRPRDRSHYEHFTSYHSALYRFVEITSVTPFSSRARDRGLHAVFISLIRHMLTQMSKESSAKRFARLSDFDYARIKDYILTRIGDVDGNISRKEAERQLDEIILNWRQFAQGPLSSKLTYSRKFPPKKRTEPHLIYPAEDLNPEFTDSYPTLNSLRNVEPELGLFRIKSK